MTSYLALAIGMLALIVGAAVIAILIAHDEIGQEPWTECAQLRANRSSATTTRPVGVAPPRRVTHPKCAFR